MKKAVFLLTTILATIFIVSCNNKSEEYIDPRGTDYAGSESCVQCHKVQSEMVFNSSHFKATAPAI